MKKHGTDQEQKPTLKQLERLIAVFGGRTAKIVIRFWDNASFAEIQAMLKIGEDNLGQTFEKLLEPMFANTDPHSAQRAYWEKIFSNHFGLGVDFSGVLVPNQPTEGKRRLIFIPQGLKMNHAAECYHKVLTAHDPKWKLWKYTNDLDATVTTNTRTSAQSYAIWVRDEVEPDAAYLGKSTRVADPDGKIGVTLLERLVHGLVHFVETKKHLDEKGVTFCTGSRHAGGDVPRMYWDPRRAEVGVDWDGLGSSDPRRGLREAVSA
ncbi:MAG: hypothetical protein AAB428_02165 [Patescibacteria group bacterium]